jgi:hypothetical protein
VARGGRREITGALCADRAAMRKTLPSRTAISKCRLMTMVGSSSSGCLMEECACRLAGSAHVQGCCAANDHRIASSPIRCGAQRSLAIRCNTRRSVFLRNSRLERFGPLSKRPISLAPLSSKLKCAVAPKPSHAAVAALQSSCRAARQPTYMPYRTLAYDLDES